jgi:hypothetical protein
LHSRSDALRQISRSLAKLLGGDAWIDPSTRLGSGSTFWFSCIVRRGKPTQPRMPLVVPSGLRRVTIYAPQVVTQGRLFNETRTWGFETEIVPNIKTLKSKVEKDGVDLMIVDPLCASADDRLNLERLTR